MTHEGLQRSGGPTDAFLDRALGLNWRYSGVCQNAAGAAFVDDAEQGTGRPAYTGGSYEILDSDCRNNALYVRRSAR